MIERVRAWRCGCGFGVGGGNAAGGKMILPTARAGELDTMAAFGKNCNLRGAEREGRIYADLSYNLFH